MNNWFITAYKQIQLEDGFRIEFYTNVPVHLFCYWTDKEPWVHRATGDRRGLLYEFFQYFCFVDWEKLDQLEAGDTLFHSFVLDNWPYCETRWFVFSGVINEEEAPSVSPIFRKHNAYFPVDTITISPTYYEPLPCQGDTYSDAHAGVNGFRSGWAYRNVTQSYRGSEGYTIIRTIAYFDLSALVDKEIHKATLYIMYRREPSIYWNEDFNCALHFRVNPPLYLPNAFVLANYHASLVGTIIATKPAPTTMVWQEYTFNVKHFVTPPTFTISVTIDKDTFSIPPAPSNTLQSAYFGVDYFSPGETDRIKLVIEYT